MYSGFMLSHCRPVGTIEAQGRCNRAVAELRAVGCRPWRLLLLVIVFGCGLAAQAPFALCRTSLRYFDSRAGLPSDTVHALHLDATGRLWAGTYDGPAYFTGRGWEPLNLPPESTSRHIRVILQTRDGAHWFGTQAGGLWRLQAGNWTHFGKGSGLPVDRINCLLETFGHDGESSLWVGTHGGGIAHLSKGAWTTDTKAQGLAGNTIWKLVETLGAEGRKQIWVGAQEGLSLYRDGAWRQVGPAEGFRGGTVNDLVVAKDKGGQLNVWVACWGFGMARWDGRAWTHFEPSSGFPSRFPSSLCVTQEPEKDSTVWAGTFDNDLLTYSGQGWQRLDRKHGSPGTGIYTMLSIPQGKPTLLMGTRGAGVAFLDLGAWRTLDEQLGLPSSEVSAFAESKEAFWIGTARGLVRFQGGRAQVENLGPDLLASFVYGLHVSQAASGQENLWAATLQGLLIREQGRWHRVQGGPVLDKKVIGFLDTAPLGGRPTLWVGTGGGLASFQDGRWQTHLTIPLISCLATTQDPDGEPIVWVGTNGQGLGCYRGGTWTWLGVEAGLPNLDINGLAVTRSRNGSQWLWIAAQGGSLTRLPVDHPGVRFEVFTSGTTPGLVVEKVSGLIADRAGYLYAPSAKGMMRLQLVERGGAPVPVLVENFTVEDGLPCNALASNYTFLDRQGRIWIGSPRGAAVLDPALETPLPPVPVLRIHKVRIGHRELTQVEHLSLDYREKNLAFEFNAPTFHRQEDTRFQTQVLGLETEPSPWLAEGRRDMTGLPAGQYELLVRARDFLGRESTPLRIPFRVQPPPWLTSWAYLAYALFLAGTARALHGWRTRRLRQQNLTLQAAVQERTAVILTQTRDLEESNVELTRLNTDKERLIDDLQGALREVDTLQGLLPICAYCKKIRNDQGFWDQMEHYISCHSRATFSHGVCPECQAQVREEIEQLKE